jgi:hypothetical protein
MDAQGWKPSGSDGAVGGRLRDSSLDSASAAWPHVLRLDAGAVAKAIVGTCIVVANDNAPQCGHGPLAAMLIERD